MVDLKPNSSVLVISSHVTRGSIGNRAAVFALEAFNIPVWAVHTVLLPWHPGHGPATRIVPSDDEFRAFTTDLQNAPWIDEIGAVLTGYVANAFQAKTVAGLVSSLKSKNPNLFYLCDPVIGDQGGLYVAEETAIAVRDHLVPLSDMITPNCFELGWLTGTQTPTNHQAVIDACEIIERPAKLVTSVPSTNKTRIGNMYIDASEGWYVSHDFLEKVPNGSGDLTAATYLARKLRGLDSVENLKTTTASVFEILTQSARKGCDELTLESDIASLISPSAEIELSQLDITS